MSKKNKFLLIILLVVSIVAIDQISKIIVREQLEYHERISVVGEMMTLTKVENTGAFLGLGKDLHRAFYYILMVGLPLVVIGYGLYYIFSKNDLSRLFIISLGFIIGGGIGNIIDRIIFGSVTDFLHFDFKLFRTGIVNFADMAVTTGFFIMLFEMYLGRKRQKVQAKESE